MTPIVLAVLLSAVAAAPAAGRASIPSDTLRRAGVPSTVPPGLRALPGERSVALSWGGTPDATAYVVKRSARSGGSYEAVARVSGTSHVDRAVEPGRSYHYVVVAANAAGEAKLASEQASAVPGPGAALVFDDSDAQVTGHWIQSAFKSNYFSAGYREAPPGAGANRIRWPLTVPADGRYSVWVWRPDGTAAHTPNAAFTVAHADGSATFRVNQRGAGGFWQRLGSETFPFRRGAPAYVELTDSANGTVIADAVRLIPESLTPSAPYAVDWTQPRQMIDGLGVEIQFDAIGSDNDMLASSDERVPEALTRSERRRWYREMLSGFRYVRLALGLYLRGTDEQGRLLRGRYPEQIAHIAETVRESGTTVSATYWSITPYFKSTGSYIGGGLKSADFATLDDLASAMVEDVAMLERSGIPISLWTLANEPDVSNERYSTTLYRPSEYLAAWRAVAPRLRATFPHIRLFVADAAGGASGSNDPYSAAVKADPDAFALVDRFSWHPLGDIKEDADVITRPNVHNDDARGRLLMGTEFEYLRGNVTDFNNTVKQLLNHLVYFGSPTFFWLHALKPTSVDNAYGYALGFFRPPSDTVFAWDHFPELPVGHWIYNDGNWNALAGFVKLMPHNSVRYPVLGDHPGNQARRLMAWRAPDGRRGLAALNDSSSPFPLTVELGGALTLEGNEFTATTRFHSLGRSEGDTLRTTLAPNSLQLWVEAPDAR